jgi:hypothetical protein
MKNVRAYGGNSSNIYRTGKRLERKLCRRRNEKEKQVMLDALLPVLETAEPSAHAICSKAAPVLTVTIHRPPVAQHQHRLLGPQPER